MPPRIQPKTYILSCKTHKLTLFTPVSQPDKTTIGELKGKVLSALQADVLHNKHGEDVEMDLAPDLDPEGEWTVPSLESTDDFELSRAVKDKGRMTGQYDVLSDTNTVKQSVANWETLFIQFKDDNGELLPVKVALPSLADEEEEEPIPALSKGKRKAGPEDFSD